MHHVNTILVCRYGKQFVRGISSPKKQNASKWMSLGELALFYSEH